MPTTFRVPYAPGGPNPLTFPEHCLSCGARRFDSDLWPGVARRAAAGRAIPPRNVSPLRQCYRSNWPACAVTACPSPQLLPYLAHDFSAEAARERLRSLGGAVEVLAPEALRLSVADWAEQIVKRYR